MKTTYISIAIFIALIMVGSAGAGGHTNHRALIDGDDFVMPVIMTTEYRPINDTLPGDNISLLSVRYDRDKDGILTEKELRITYRDYMHSQLSPRESAQFIELIGFVPIPAGNMHVAYSPEPEYDDDDCVKMPELVENAPTYDCECDEPMGKKTIKLNNHEFYAEVYKLVLKRSGCIGVILNDDVEEIKFKKYAYDNKIYIPRGAAPIITGNGEDNEGNDVICYDNSPPPAP